MYNLKKKGGGGASQKSLIVTKMICLYKMCVSLYLFVNICFAGRGPIIERGKVGIPLYFFNSLFYKCVHVLSGFP